MELLTYNRVTTQDLDLGTGVRETRLQDTRIAALQQIDPGVEWCYQTGRLSDYVGKGRTSLISRPTTIGAAVTIPADETVIIEGGGSLILNANVTCNGRILAGRRQIFSGNGTISFTGRDPAVLPEWWGSDFLGVTDSKASFDKALTSLPSTGGLLLGGGPGATYKFDSAIADVRKSNITIDMQGALCKSAFAFNLVEFNGDSGIDGNYSQVIENCIFRNARIGAANDASNLLAPPAWEWTKNCLMENVHIQGAQNGINSFVNTNMTIRKCSIKGMGTGQIAMLHYMGNDCTYEDIKIDYDNAAVAGACFQIKGGRNNTVHACVVRNVLYNGVSSFRFAFFVRGDAPWDASLSGPRTYPFSTLGFSVPDARRASINTRLSACSVENCPSITAFEVQEDTGTKMVDCAAYNCRRGLNVNKISNGQERDFHAVGCQFEHIGIADSAGASGFGMSVISAAATPYAGASIEGCTVRGASGNGITCEFTEDVIIRDCHFYDCGQGAVVGDQRGVSVTNNNVRPQIISCVANDTRTGGSRTQQVGIFIGTSSTLPKIKDCTGSNNVQYQCQAWLPGEYAGNYPGEGVHQTTNATPYDDALRFTLATGQAAWIEVEAVAKQGTTAHAYYKIGGLFYNIAGTATQVGTTRRLINPPDITALTDNSGGSANNTIAAIPSIDVAGAGNASSFTETRDAVADLAAKINELVNGIAPLESVSAWGGISFATSGDTVIVRITGAAATTIDWVLKARCVSVL